VWIFLNHHKLTVDAAAGQLIITITKVRFSAIPYEAAGELAFMLSFMQTIY
jgi:hypothetical protein